MESVLKANEELTDLALSGLRIIQSTSDWRFGMDSVLLADFAVPGEGDRVIDLGAGDGALLLLLAGRAAGISGLGIEKRPEAAERAQRSIRVNGLEDRLRVVCADWADTAQYAREAAYSLAVANPPYYASRQDGMKYVQERVMDERQWETLFSAAAYALKRHGRAVLVCPGSETDRALAVMLRKGFALRRMRCVYTKPGREAKLVLIEGCRDGKQGGAHMLPPLEIWTDEGKTELKCIYHEQ